MALTCKIIRTSKKPNSTKVPSFTNAKEYAIVLKEDTSILRPSFMFSFANLQEAVEAIGCNYCLCQSLERLYYITDWESSGNIWIAHCQVDVLATYRMQIGESEQYLLRTANGYRLSVPDVMFPVTTTPDIVRTDCTDMSYSNGNSFWSTNLQMGTYVLGVLNGEESTIGCVCYYALSYSEFDSLRGALMSGDDWFMEGVTDVSVGVMKSLVNPMQYITTCYWLPISLPYLVESGICRANTAADPNICFGFWDSGVTGYRFASLEAVNSAKIVAPNHPDGCTFHNYAPYSRDYLYLPPLGYVTVDRNLNPDILGSVWSIVCNIDVATGKAIWWIDGYPQKWECQVGIPINLSMANIDYLGMIPGLSGGIGGAVASAATGNWGGAISNIASGIISAVDASLPQISSGGGNGSFVGIWNDRPHLITVQYREVDVDVAKFGRPACFTAKINGSLGYKLCANAAIEINGALEPEVAEIVEVLNRGFYYE